MKAALVDEKFRYAPWRVARCAACGAWAPAPLDDEVVFCQECAASAQPDELSELYVDLGGGD